jgi:hypothetical protein
VRDNVLDRYGRAGARISQHAQSIELNLMRQADELARAAARGVNLLTRKIDCEAL